MPLPPITRFSSLATNPSATNNNNGLYAPPLNTAQIAAIPAKTKVNGGIWYNEDVGQLEAVVQNKVQPIPVGIGGGNVVGPGVSVIDNIATFGNITGTLIKDSGLTIDNLVSGAGKGTTNIGDIAIFADVNGKLIQDGGLVSTDIVINSTGGTANNIAIFSDDTGKLIADSGVDVARVPLATPLLRFANASAAPNVTVNEIGNLGHIKFTNGLGLVFVDSLMPVEFITNTYKTVTQVCSLFTDGLPSSSTSPSALVEIQSDTGALLLSRMTETERDNLSTPSGANGMLLFNTTSGTFNGFDGTKWRDLLLLNIDGTLDLKNKNIINLLDPANAQDAATKAYVDAAVSGIPTATITLTGNVTGSGLVTSPIITTLNMTLDQIKAPVASVSLGNHKIINLLDPASAQEGATKNYVDTRTITVSGAVIGSGALGTTIATTLTNITTSQITNFNAAVTAFRLDQFAAPTTSVSLGNHKIINLLDPTLAQDGATKNYVDISISGSGFAPGLATYIVQTATNKPTNAQVLGSLTTGLLKNTNTTGVLSTAVAGTDYYSPGNPTRIIDVGNNFFIGTNAGNLTSTSPNTGVGINVLASLTSGHSNVAVGYNSQTATTSGTFNTSVGRESLFQNIIGFNNSAFGSKSLYTNTASNNSAFGSNALNSNTTGTPNDAFGSLALFNNVGGSNNASFGYLSLTTNTTGSQNAAFGTTALTSNVSGNQNAAFGYQSLQSNVGGSFNAAFGARTLSANLADGNSAFGTQALLSNINGLSNAAFATQALNANVNGSNNSAFGYAALFSSTSDSNSAFGTNSLQMSTTGTLNTAFGYLAGGTHLLYNNCSFFGAQADASVNNLTNAVAIGYQASVGASNCMVLGGSGGNQLSVGIGITPNAQFQLPNAFAHRKIVLFEATNNDNQVIALGVDLILGNNSFAFQIDSTTSTFNWYAGTSPTTSNVLMTLTGAGFLGIGAVGLLGIPHAQLQLPTNFANRKIVLYETVNNDHQFYGLGVNSGVFRYQVDSTSSAHIFYAGMTSSTSNELMRLTGTGFLGIGTSTPNAPLQFANTIANRKIVLYDSFGNDHQFSGLGINGTIFRFQIPVTDNYIFYAGTSTTTSNELMRLTGAGILNVGGTSSLAQIVATGGVANIANEASCIRAISSLSGSTKIELQNTFSINRLWEIRALSAGNFDITDRIGGATRFTIDTIGISYLTQSNANYYGTVTATTTTSATPGNFVKLTWPGPLLSTTSNYNFITPSRATYTGSITTTQTINVTITAGHNGATVGEITTFAIYKNGALVSSVRDTITAVTIASGTIYSIKTVFLTKGTTVANNDYFEIYVAHTVASRVISVTDFSFDISST